MNKVVSDKRYPRINGRAKSLFYALTVAPPTLKAMPSMALRVGGTTREAKRYLTRMEKIYEGIFSSSHDRDSYDDDVISFFIHCYHVRDWIIHLNRLGVTAKEVDLYINSHRSLMICADLANGSKHCKLTRSLRTERQPHISGTRRDTSGWLTGDGGGEVMKCKYTVLSNEDFLDALELARDSVTLWEKYMVALQEAYNKSKQQEPSAGTC